MSLRAYARVSTVAMTTVEVSAGRLASYSLGSWIGVSLDSHETFKAAKAFMSASLIKTEVAGWLTVT